MNPVLLVDDDPSVLAGLRQILDLEQIGAATADGTAAAHELIARQFFPLILADLRLRSDRDGLELIGHVRRISPRSKIAVMSGAITPEIEAYALQAGASAVLRKPFDTDDFIATVRALLDSPPPGSDDEAIYRATTPRLRAMIARRYGLTRDESEDVLQQAWCVLLERRGEVRDVGAFLSGTVVNLSRQTIQRNVRELGLDSAPPERPSTTDHVTRLAVRSALARLDERSRALCTLIGLEQLEYGEVSEHLSIPLGSVGPLYIRAKKRLARELAN